MHRLVVLLAALAWATPSLAESPHSFGVGVSHISYGGIFRASPSRTALELGWAYTPEHFWRELPLSFGAGVRAALPDGVGVPFEGFGRVRLTAPLKAWRPAVGFELGVGGFATPAPREDGLPNDFDAFENLGAVYYGFDVAPLRFRFGRFQVSAFELQLATTLGSQGGALRTRLGWLQVEVTP